MASGLGLTVDMIDDDPVDYPRRVPRDAFEVEVFRRILYAEFAKWPGLVVTLGEGHADGRFGIDVRSADAPFSLDTFLDQPHQDGEAWLIERTHPASEHFLVGVAWRLGAEQGVDGPPVVAHVRWPIK